MNQDQNQDQDQDQQDHKRHLCNDRFDQMEQDLWLQEHLEGMVKIEMWKCQVEQLRYQILKWECLVHLQIVLLENLLHDQDLLITLRLDRIQQIL